MDIENARLYLIEVLHKKLYDSNEYSDDYRALAKKYWPEEFGNTRRIVHHIDGNHFNNVLSNLVVLTYKEHVLIHRLFDDNYRTKEPVYKPKQKHSKLIVRPDLSERAKIKCANQPRIHGRFAAKH